MCINREKAVGVPKAAETLRPRLAEDLVLPRSIGNPRLTSGEEDHDRKRRDRSGYKGFALIFAFLQSADCVAVRNVELVAAKRSLQ